MSTHLLLSAFLNLARVCFYLCVFLSKNPQRIKFSYFVYSNSKLKLNREKCSITSVDLSLRFSMSKASLLEPLELRID